MTNFDKVGTFMKTFGQEVKTSPSFSTDKIKNLRYSLIKEELDELKDASNINVESIDDNIIEVHLRPNPDPIDKHKELIVCWEDSTYDKEAYFKNGYEYIESYDDAGGKLPIPRLGFLALPIVPRARNQYEP